MKILIAYTSVEGQTRKIAEHLAATVEHAGHRAALLNLAAAEEFGLERPDAVIVCAPIHNGRYHAECERFLAREKDWLSSLPSAFVSVSLLILSENADERAENEAITAEFLARGGWQPTAVHHAAGALRYAEYDFFKRWMVRRVVGKALGPKAAAGGETVELTDFAALDAFAADFLRKATS